MKEDFVKRGMFNAEYAMTCAKLKKSFMKKIAVAAKSPSWLYGHYELEAFLLLRMIREKNEAKLKVGYTKDLRIPSTTAYFRVHFPTGAKKEFRFRACGNAEVFADQKHIAAIPQTADIRKVSILGVRAKTLTVKLTVSNAETELPALLPLTAGFKDWQFSADGITFEYPIKYDCNVDAAVYPHDSAQETVTLTPKKISTDTWDIGYEVFGKVEILGTGNPEMFIGESIEEVRNENAADEEQTRELVRISPKHLESKVKLALRYIRLKNADPDTEVKFTAFYQPVWLRGSFQTNDLLLNDIWSHSVYTIHLCMNNFLLDGIKRDRLPWAGDLAVSMMANAYSFGDAGIVKSSLLVLGATGIEKSHINTIPDYTMWWLISHDLFQRYFGDTDFLKMEYPRIRETVEILLSRSDENGFLKFSEQDWPFIDWVPGKKTTAVQILYVKALRAAAALAKRIKDKQNAMLWNAAADKLQGNIRARAFNAKQGLFTEAPESNVFSRHANMLAIYAGVVSESEAKHIAGELAKHEMPRVGTPYMSIFEAIALFSAGCVTEAMALIEEIWGGMLNYGASTFFEGFNPDEKGVQHLVFYDRPYGKSLCHAWGAGPAFFLPGYLFGIQPVTDGWKKFTVKPAIHGLAGSISVPTPYGDITVEIESNDDITITYPKECKLSD